AFFFHQVHFADIKEISHFELVSLYPVYTCVSILAMIAAGWGLDRWGTARLMPYMQLPMILAFLLFATTQSLELLTLGLMFLALNTGFHATLAAAFWSEFYGTAHIGSIKAMAAAIMVLGSALGPGITGLGIDLGVGLETQYFFVAGFFAFATAMMAIGIRRAAPLLTLPT
ncbi:MAG: MFS transporter, partial [Pseudomonadota bacterium]